MRLERRDPLPGGLHGGLALLLVLATVGFSANAWAQVCTSTACQSFITIKDGQGILIYRTYDLSLGSSAVRHVVFVVHGSARNAAGAFSTMVSVSNSLGKLNETLIISPFFKATEDAPGASDLYWTSSGWKDGSPSYGPAVSSYEVIDLLTQSIIEGGLFPNVGMITVVGHSAGGQFTQRYAAGNPSQALYPSIKYNYVVTNPSSYMYLNAYRPVSGTVDQFAIPTGCGGYDYYKYGLVSRNAYMNKLPASELISRYLPRHVSYLVGSADTLTTDDLDITCQGNVQGLNRYVRGLAYANHINKYFPNNNHSSGVVEGVGHSSSGMWTSAVGKAAIFPDPSTIPPTNGTVPPATRPRAPGSFEVW